MSVSSSTLLAFDELQDITEPSALSLCVVLLEKHLQIDSAIGKLAAFLMGESGVERSVLGILSQQHFRTLLEGTNQIVLEFLLLSMSE